MTECTYQKISNFLDWNNFVTKGLQDEPELRIVMIVHKHDRLEAIFPLPPYPRMQKPLSFKAKYSGDKKVAWMRISNGYTGYSSVGGLNENLLHVYYLPAVVVIKKGLTAIGPECYQVDDVGDMDEGKQKAILDAIEGDPPGHDFEVDADREPDLFPVY
ncbi:hypothetical protein LTR97_011158 [Elasticomyces elasticus]|uniref:Uncharacterized protein n=1 Tax=Elasticomyces elasticus TaxID=574655 RepID=A0AAN7VT07_9PEZI|nr:hypothetical protein LTR97_011158 [Elasticomyces elasticus]